MVEAADGICGNAGESVNHVGDIHTPQTSGDDERTDQRTCQRPVTSKSLLQFSDLYTYIYIPYSVHIYIPSICKYRMYV